MSTEDELLQRLEAWVVRQPSPPTLSDVLRTGDIELFGAYVLKGFRIAAAKAVAENERVAHARSAVLEKFGGDAQRAESFLGRKHPLLDGATPLAKAVESEAGAEQAIRLARLDIPPAAIRAFEGISRVWGLSRAEEAALLGVDVDRIAGWRKQSPDHLPDEVLERISLLLGIYKGINILLPQPDRADRWIRASNSAALFGGHSALDVIIRDGIAGMRGVRAYLEENQ